MAGGTLGQLAHAEFGFESGTLVAAARQTHFHAYATVSIVHDQRRYVLALVFVEKGSPMVAVVRQLLNRVKRLKIKVRRVYLDKGF